MTYDENKVVEATRMLLEAIGEDPTREGLLGTPDRVGRAWRELLCGYEKKAEEVLKTDFEMKVYDQPIALSNVAFYSTCEHHLIPFFGKAYVAYLPAMDGRVVGLSKLARLVEMHARRLQIQERMAHDIANDLERILKPRGVVVILKAQHLCMAARGIKKPGSVMTTSMITGEFRSNTALRSEIYSIFGLTA